MEKKISRISNITIPQEVKKILDTLNGLGHEAYIVGGCVRDIYLGRKPKDWDITTSAKPEEVKKAFKHTYDTGIEHGTVSVRLNLEIYEVTTYRVDGEYTDHRRPDHVSFTASLEEDLKRRDFTMNAMAYHPDQGIVDLFGGREDLERQVIRCVGDPNERFEEDALRMLRAIRFASRFGFEIETRSWKAILEKAPLLQKVSAERIREELNQVLISDHPEMIRKIVDSGMMQYIIPEFVACRDCEQKTPYHLYPVEEHTYKVMNGISRQSDYTLVLRWAGLLHDIAKPLCKTTDEKGQDHFFGHPEKSAEMANDILRRLKFDNYSRKLIVLLIEKHDHSLPKTETQMRFLLNSLPDGAYPMILELMIADAGAKNPIYGTRSMEELQQARALYQSVLDKHQCIKLADLAVNGKDMIAMGFSNGKQIGTILDLLLKQTLENPEINRKDLLLSIAEQLMEKLGVQD